MSTAKENHELQMLNTCIEHLHIAMLSAREIKHPDGEVLIKLIYTACRYAYEAYQETDLFKSGEGFIEF